MRRSLFVLLVAAAACGGKQKSTTPPPPLPEPKAEAPKPAEPQAKQEAKEPEPPPIPKGPIEIALDAPKVTVKLVSPGKGKKTALKLTPKAGLKQQLELAIDFAGKQTAPPELGGPQEEIAPTAVLLADIEAKEVSKEGVTKFLMTFSGVDARDVSGSKKPAAEFKTELLSLTGATIGGTVNADGTITDMTLHLEKPDQHTMAALALIKLSLMPMWPVLPKEAIAPGAKWQVTYTQKVADRLEVTQTTDYELVAKKGKAWTLKGSTKVSGKEQEIEQAKFGQIGGTGTTEATVNEGNLVSPTKQSVKTDFTATATPAPNQSVSLQFHLEQANALTPKP